MNISIKNEEGETVVAAPEMDLYTVADQVHKNEKIESINALKEQAAIREAGPIIENPNDATIDEETAQKVADAVASFLMEHKDPVTDLPSNNDQEKHEPEEGETKLMKVSINPQTGEHVPVGEVDEDCLGDDETFEEMVERVKNSDIKLDDSPFTEEEITDYLKSDQADSIFKEIAKDTEFAPETIKGILEVTNRKLKGEEFNVYKALPKEIQQLINTYCVRGTIPLNTPNGNQFRNMVSEQLISEFISNIGLTRIQSDFSKELEEIFNKGTKEISESIVGYTQERSKAYREAAEKMEDPEKKAKLTAILDRVDEGYNLTELKAFAKTFKIKKYDLERPDKVYRAFVRKYENSKFNIYGIDMAIPIILRNINKDENDNPIPIDSPDHFDETDINAFFIAFCEQTKNYRPNEDAADHAYMYYVMYNCVFTEINTGDSKNVSKVFLQNIKDVIINLRERNDNFGR